MNVEIKLFFGIFNRYFLAFKFKITNLVVVIKKLRNIFKVNNWKIWFSNLTNKDLLYHGVFWISLFLILVVSDRSELTLPFKLIKEFVNILFFGTIVYINLYLLIPSFLKEKKYLLYAFALLLFVVLITPVKTMIYYVLFTGNNVFTERLIESQPYIFISNLFFGFGSTIFQILSDWRESEDERRELELQNTQTELNFLKSQINPHFLFNTLNNIYALTLIKSDVAPETVIKLSEIMRYMLYECNEEKVPLLKEIQFIKNYYELEKLRLKSNSEIILSITGDTAGYKIAPLILNPFIENAFKHGINSNVNSAYVHISLLIEKQQLEFEIENNIPKVYREKKNGGIGLKNVKRRLEIIYPEEHELSIKDQENIFQVKLKLKLDK